MLKWRLKMFYPSDWAMWQTLISIKKGLENNYDMVLLVAGDTGTGKSNLNLHLVESWQKLIGKPIDDDLILQINVDKIKWLNEFKKIHGLDINTFDEGAAGLGSKQSMETFSKSLEMLFQVVRYKRFFTVIIVPNFFRLNKFFREDRIRGLIYINKRGEYAYHTRERIIKLCFLNSRLLIKNMNLVTPAFRGRFPEYKGILSKAYDDMKEEGVNKILDEVIYINTDKNEEKNKNIRKKEEKIEWWIRKMYSTGTITGRDQLWKTIINKFDYPYPRTRILKLLKETTPKEYEKSKKMEFE